MALGFMDYWVGFWKYVGWWLVPIVVMFIYKKMLGKYPISVTVYEKRGQDLIVTNDVAGRFDNPVNCYKLKMSKDTMPIPQYDWVLQNMYRPTNLFEKFSNLLSGKIGHLTVFKYSSKQYKPIKVHMANGVKTVLKEIKDSQGNPIYVHVYEPINVQRSMSKLDFEVIDWDDINHMTQELRAIALRRAPLLGFLEKYGGWIAFLLGVLMMIFAGYYYKEMLLDAGARYQSMTGATSPDTNNQTSGAATVPNIPLIGDIQ